MIHMIRFYILMRFSVKNHKIAEQLSLRMALHILLSIATENDQISSESPADMSKSALHVPGILVFFDDAPL